ncbi:protein suppressor of white apricot isoform X3 [Drosophila sechellia]|uniref:protein suppressor of white apricot isoform X3 n=1 Tax=Drosophila sechellia TaxID=7238 RepID=UPI0013DE0E49|nr:protein suppressor of white apricot isoform X3 [Drosophila sechellia]
MMPYNVRNAGGGSVGGILRRTGQGSATVSTILGNGNTPGALGTGKVSSSSLENHRQPPLELLVFGYACKIFRDDEKAREMDHGKQLIPWMGDVNLKIDRYDVRGALCELAPHEAPPGGYGNRLEYLSAEEQRAEQLCEEERYLFLYNNEEELRLRQGWSDFLGVCSQGSRSMIALPGKAQALAIFVIQLLPLSLSLCISLSSASTRIRFSRSDLN